MCFLFLLSLLILGYFLYHWFMNFIKLTFSVDYSELTFSNRFTGFALYELGQHCDEIKQRSTAQIFSGNV